MKKKIKGFAAPGAANKAFGEGSGIASVGHLGADAAGQPPAGEPAAPLRTRTILLVDDDDANRVATKWFLNYFGYVVETASDAESALALFSPRLHDLVVTDNAMPGMSGVELAHVIKLRSPATPVFMYTGRVPDDQSCVDRVLLRPASFLTLKDAVDQLLAASKPATTPSPSPRPGQDPAP